MKKFTNVILVLFLFTSIASAQWVQLGTININSFSQYGSTFFACYNSGTDKTTNEGTTWSSVGTGGGINYSFSYKNANVMVAGTESYGVRYTTTGGPWWNSSITWTTHSVLTDGTDFYAGTSQGVYKSTNNGQNWTSIGLSATNVTCMIKQGTYLFAGSSAGLYISSNNGSSWNLDSHPYSINCLAYGNSLLWIGTGTGLWWSDDLGTTWHNVTTTNSYISIALNASNVYVSRSTGGVYHLVQVSPGPPAVYQFASRNAGFTTPLPVVNALIVTNNYVLAGTATGLWRSPLAYVTDVKPQVTSVCYELSQNFPNPFNPTTTIRYQISKAQFVSIKVFDITGKVVETLVSEKQSPGTYEVKWNASHLSSGVYFYKLESINFTETKSMLLVK